MNYISHAEWPEGTCRDMYGKPHSQDTHGSLDSAQSVCSLLELEGFGGLGQVFPIKTWTEPEINEIDRQNLAHAEAVGRAADRAAKYLREGLRGLAICKAVQETGVNKKELEAELLRRRLANKAWKDKQKLKDNKAKAV